MGKKSRRHNNKKNRKEREENQADLDTNSGEGSKKCPHLSKSAKLGVLQNHVPHIKLGNCSFCGSSKDIGVCICLRCGKQGCDRYSDDQHALNHYNENPSHNITLHLQSMLVWCYGCDMELPVVPNSDLYECVKLIIKGLNLDAPQDQKLAISKLEKSTAERQVNNITSSVASSNQKIKGLVNLGNTCFFNAVMQNLNQTELLHIAVAFVNQSEYSQRIKGPHNMLTVQVTNPAGSLLMSLNKLLSDFRSSSPGPLNPKFLFSEICKKAPRFKGFQQQDSQELLRYLLDSVKTDQLKRVKVGVLKQFEINEGVDIKSLPAEKKEKIKEYVQAVTEPCVDSVFSGKLDSIIICHQCHKESRVTEDFLDLSLSLVVPEVKQVKSKSNKAGELSAGIKNLDTAVQKEDTKPQKMSKHQQKVAKEAKRKKNRKKGKQRTLSRSSEDDSHGIKSEIDENDAEEDENTPDNERDSHFNSKTTINDNRNDLNIEEKPRNEGNNEESIITESSLNETDNENPSERIDATKPDEKIDTVNKCTVELMPNGEDYTSAPNSNEAIDLTLNKMSLNLSQDFKDASLLSNKLEKNPLNVKTEKNSEDVSPGKQLIGENSLLNSVETENSSKNDCAGHNVALEKNAKNTVELSICNNDDISEHNSQQETTIENREESSLDDSSHNLNAVPESKVEFVTSGKDNQNLNCSSENKDNICNDNLEKQVPEGEEPVTSAFNSNEQTNYDAIVNKSQTCQLPSACTDDREMADPPTKSMGSGDELGCQENPMNGLVYVETNECSALLEDSCTNRQNVKELIDISSENSHEKAESEEQCTAKVMDDISNGLDKVDLDEEENIDNEITSSTVSRTPPTEILSASSPMQNMRDGNGKSDSLELLDLEQKKDADYANIGGGNSQLEEKDNNNQVETRSFFENEQHSSDSTPSPTGISSITSGERSIMYDMETDSVSSSVDTNTTPKVFTIGPPYITSLGECSVQSCLAQFCAPEVLEGRNKFLCEECSKQHSGQSDDDDASSSDESTKGAKGAKTPKAIYTEATKQLLISSTPPVLTLHLKRFQQVGRGLRKLAKHVEFPFLLDVAPFCCRGTEICPDSKQSVVYSLIGLVEHSGGLNSGHYTACIKLKHKPTYQQPNDLSSTKDLISFIQNIWTEDKEADYVHEEPGNGQWYYVSDSRATMVTEEKVRRSQAYMLFYERLPLKRT